MRWFRNERGTTTLEMVMVLPVLIFLTLAVMEVSRAWLTVTLVTTAAREGARLAALAPAAEFPSPAAAVAQVNALVNGASSSFTCTPAPCAPGSTVRATVSVAYQTAVPLVLPMLSSLTIRQVVSMRYE
jgi:Flp pilus assembly protein TadG